MLTKSKAGEKKMKYQDWDCRGQTRWLTGKGDFQRDRREAVILGFIATAWLTQASSLV